MLKEENIRNIQKILKKKTIVSDLIKDYTIEPISSNLEEAHQVIRLFCKQQFAYGIRSQYRS